MGKNLLKEKKGRYVKTEKTKEKKRTPEYPTVSSYRKQDEGLKSEEDRIIKI